MGRPSSASRARQEDTKEAKKLCIVATEDSKTGGFAYFEEFRSIQKYRFLAKYSFKMEVIPSSEGKSAPNWVLENLTERMKSLQANGFEVGNDEFWIICDIDHLKPEQLDEVVEECKKLKVDFAFSNPCFEIWVLYHQKDFDNDPPFETSQACKKAANELLDRRKDRYEGLITDMHLQYAVKHAEAAHRPQSEQWPRSQGSHVYKLMKSLLE